MALLSFNSVCYTVSTELLWLNIVCAWVLAWGYYGSGEGNLYHSVAIALKNYNVKILLLSTYFTDVNTYKSHWLESCRPLHSLPCDLTTQGLQECAGSRSKSRREADLADVALELFSSNKKKSVQTLGSLWHVVGKLSVLSGSVPQRCQPSAGWPGHAERGLWSQGSSWQTPPPPGQQGWSCGRTPPTPRGQTSEGPHEETCSSDKPEDSSTHRHMSVWEKCKTHGVYSELGLGWYIYSSVLVLS